MKCFKSNQILTFTIKRNFNSLGFTRFGYCYFFKTKRTSVRPKAQFWVDWPDFKRPIYKFAEM
jgi:hypothetical protein